VIDAVWTASSNAGLSFWRESVSLTILLTPCLSGAISG